MRHIDAFLQFMAAASPKKVKSTAIKKCLIAAAGRTNRAILRLIFVFLLRKFRTLNLINVIVDGDIPKKYKLTML